MAQVGHSVAVSRGRDYSPSVSLLDTCKHLSQQKREIEECDRELQKWENRKRRSVKVSVALRRVGLDRRGRAMETCGEVFVRSVCKGCGQTANVTQTYHCNDRLCPVCASRRSARLSGKWGRGIEAFQAEYPGHAYFLTLTFADTDALQPFSSYTRPRKLLFRHPFWKRYGLIGGISAFETKLGKNSGKWHSHFHVVIFTRREIPLIETGKHAGEFQNSVNQEIADLWRELTGDSFIVKGVVFDGDTRELTKYMTKAPDRLPDDRLSELAQWGRGKRFLSAFGKCYNNPHMREAMQEGEEEHSHELKPCECGCRDFELHIFHWSDAVGAFLPMPVVHKTVGESPPDG